MPSQPGEQADRASKWGYFVIRALMIGHTRSSWEMPTCTWIPQINIWEPQYWVRLMISA